MQGWPEEEHEMKTEKEMSDIQEKVQECMMCQSSQERKSLRFLKVCIGQSRGSSSTLFFMYF